MFIHTPISIQEFETWTELKKNGGGIWFMFQASLTQCTAITRRGEDSATLSKERRGCSAGSGVLNIELLILVLNIQVSKCCLCEPCICRLPNCCVRWGPGESYSYCLWCSGGWNGNTFDQLKLDMRFIEYDP